MFHESDVDALHRTWPFNHQERPTRQRFRLSETSQRAAHGREPRQRRALARFDQVEGVSDADRDLAFANIKKAAEHYGIEVHEKEWRELGKK
jgi:hypothetical protein